MVGTEAGTLNESPPIAMLWGESLRPEANHRIDDSGFRQQMKILFHHALCWRKEPSRIRPWMNFWEKRIRAESMTILIWQLQFQLANQEFHRALAETKPAWRKYPIDPRTRRTMLQQISEETTPAFCRFRSPAPARDRLSGSWTVADQSLVRHPSEWGNLNKFSGQPPGYN